MLALIKLEKKYSRRTNDEEEYQPEEAFVQYYNEEQQPEFADVQLIEKN